MWKRFYIFYFTDQKKNVYKSYLYQLKHPALLPRESAVMKIRPVKLLPREKDLDFSSLRCILYNLVHQGMPNHWYSWMSLWILPRWVLILIRWYYSGSPLSLAECRRDHENSWWFFSLECRFKFLSYKRLVFIHFCWILMVIQKLNSAYLKIPQNESKKTNQAMKA